MSTVSGLKSVAGVRPARRPGSRSARPGERVRVVATQTSWASRRHAGRSSTIHWGSVSSKMHSSIASALSDQTRAARHRRGVTTHSERSCAGNRAHSCVLQSKVSESRVLWWNDDRLSRPRGDDTDAPRGDRRVCGGDDRRRQPGVDPQPGPERQTDARRGARARRRRARLRPDRSRLHRRGNRSRSTWGSRGSSGRRAPRTRILAAGRRASRHASTPSNGSPPTRAPTSSGFRSTHSAARSDSTRAGDRRNPGDVALVTLLDGQQRGRNRAADCRGRGARRGRTASRCTSTPCRPTVMLPIRFRARSGARVRARRRSACPPTRSADRSASARSCVARGRTVVPLIHGGGQQRQVRSGTQDVAAAVSFAVAAVARDSRACRPSSCASPRCATAWSPGSCRRFRRPCRTAIPGAGRSGSPATPTSRFPAARATRCCFCSMRPGSPVSTGSACQAGIPEPSHVLRAMGRSEIEARGALRITLGRTSTEADVDAFLARAAAAYAQARAGPASPTARRPSEPGLGTALGELGSAGARTLNR